MLYQTKAGDMLDAICWRYYGERPGAFEAVLKANHELACLGCMLPEGLIIQLPELPALQVKQIALWD